MEVGQEWRRRTELENKVLLDSDGQERESYASLNDAYNVGLYYLYKYFHYNRQNIIKKIYKMARRCKPLIQVKFKYFGLIDIGDIVNFLILVTLT